MLNIGIERVLVMSVVSVTSAQRALDALQVASVVATSDSNNASQVLAVTFFPDAAANLIQQLQTLGM